MLFDPFETDRLMRKQMLRKKEIGSEFWDVPLGRERNDIFKESAQWFLSGRSALQAIIQELHGCHSISIPSWCCDSMVKPFIEAGFTVRFYPVLWEDGLVQETDLHSDVLFLMDYFGYTTPATDISDYKGIVIRDLTHSVFSATYNDADYYFGSLRKWCGVWTGGYTWAKDGHRLSMEQNDDFGYKILREKAMQLKNNYIHDRDAYDKGYLQVFDEAEEKLDHVSIAPAADRDVILAQQLDVEFIKGRRRANAEVLRSAFPEWLIFREMKETDCPMFVPVLIPEGRRNALRKYLIEQEIYCPIHWPVSEYHKLDQKTETLYNHELSLVCDQRYTEEDMKRMVETINQFMEG